MLLDPLGGHAADQPEGGSAWPWRSALGVISWYVTLPAAPSATAVRRAENFVAAGHHAVTDVSTGGYVNYFEVGRPLSSYYGASFARLRAVRERYDPTSFFKTPYSIP